MSALDFIRQQMDELMGKDRDGEAIGPQHFTDEEVCKNFLCGLCTADLFTNTKRETGPCGQIHDDKLRDQYLEAQKEGKTFDFEQAHLRYLERLMADQEVELRRADQRLKATQSDDTNPESDKIMDIGNDIGKKLAAAEALGEEGKVDEAQTLLDEIETLKRQKKILEDDLKNSLPPGATQQQKLRVCDVCAAYLSLFDSDRRLADHFGGKVHMGCLKIRQQYDEWKQRLNKRREDRDRRDSTRDRDRDRERERDRDRERSSRRSRSRDRDRRDRDSDRDRRDKDRDYDRRDRDRDRDRRRDDRDNRRRSRSRDRDRDRRSSRY